LLARAANRSQKAIHHLGKRVRMYGKKEVEGYTHSDKKPCWESTATASCSAIFPSLRRAAAESCQPFLLHRSII